MLTEAEIKRLIEEDVLSEKKRLAAVGQRYYEAEHDILDYRLFYYNADGILVEDKTRSNIKITHPFFTELVDQFAAYMLSFEDNPIRAKESADGLQEHLDLYFDDEFWAEIQELITGTNAKGFEYLYAYKNADDRLAFKCADSLGVVEVRANDMDDHCQYIIYWYVDRVGEDKKQIKKVRVYDADQIYFYTQIDDGSIVLDDSQELNPRPNVVWKDDKTGTMYGDSLGFVPFWRLDNNEKQFSGLKPIKALIDDYDLMECSLSNNLQDFVDGMYVVKGFAGDNMDELITNLKTKKAIGVDTDGDVDIRTVDIPYEARKTKADEDEKNIYRFGMGFNSSQIGDGNITNVVIRSRYTLLNLKARKFGNRLKRFLKDIINVVLDEINAVNGTDYRYTDIKVTLKPIIPTDEQEDAQVAYTEAQTEQIRINTILNVAAVIGDDETLKSICGILDLDYEELRDQVSALNEVQNTFDAQSTLDGVKPEDDNITEQVASAEESLGKPLNGAQTASLLSIIAQYKAGTLTADEAVSIIAISIGISEQKARKLLRLEDGA